MNQLRKWSSNPSAFFQKGAGIVVMIGAYVFGFILAFSFVHHFILEPLSLSSHTWAGAPSEEQIERILSPRATSQPREKFCAIDVMREGRWFEGANLGDAAPLGESDRNNPSTLTRYWRVCYREGHLAAFHVDQSTDIYYAFKDAVGHWRMTRDEPHDETPWYIRATISARWKSKILPF
jgi:hypothetical protein